MARYISAAERDRIRKVHLVTSSRCERYGAIPGSTELWWEQAQTVARDLSINLSWEEVQWRDPTLSP